MEAEGLVIDDATQAAITPFVEEAKRFSESWVKERMEKQEAELIAMQGDDGERGEALRYLVKLVSLLEQKEQNDLDRLAKVKATLPSTLREKERKSRECIAQLNSAVPFLIAAVLYINNDLTAQAVLEHAVTNDFDSITALGRALGELLHRCKLRLSLQILMLMMHQSWLVRHKPRSRAAEPAATPTFPPTASKKAPNPAVSSSHLNKSGRSSYSSVESEGETKGSQGMLRERVSTPHNTRLFVFSLFLTST